MKVKLAENAGYCFGVKLAVNAAEENASWPVDAMAALEAFRTSVPAPATSSGWYFPSIKELNIACSGDYPYSITDYDNEGTEVYDIITESLAKIPGANDYYEDYISSTELGAYDVYDMMAYYPWVPDYGVGKNAGMTFRAVLAF